MSKRHTLGVSKWLPSTKDKITFKKGGGELDQFLRLDVKREKRNGDGELELIINFLPLYATIFSMFVLFALLKLPTATMVAFLGLLYICVGRITQTVIYPLECYVFFSG